MSAGGCQEEASRGVVSIQLAVGIAVASSTATALVCGVLWAFYGRTVARRNGRRLESAIVNDRKSTEDLHERQSSATQTDLQIAAPISLLPSQTTPLATSSQVLSAQGPSLMRIQPSHGHCPEHPDGHEGAATSSNRQDTLVSPARISSHPKVGHRQGPAAPAHVSAMARLATTDSTSSLRHHTPSVYRFAPPESIVRSRQSPPNLTTEYSVVSLDRFAEFAPWVTDSVLNEPEAQRPML